ncbi:MAG: hypothetical protein AB2A00_10385 [Myxococcota bacterium]
MLRALGNARSPSVLALAAVVTVLLHASTGASGTRRNAPSSAEQELQAAVDLRVEMHLRRLQATRTAQR